MVGCCVEDKGGSRSAQIWKFNYNCALAVIPAVEMGRQSGRRDGSRRMNDGRERGRESGGTNGFKLAEKWERNISVCVLDFETWPLR